MSQRANRQCEYYNGQNVQSEADLVHDEFSFIGGGCNCRYGLHHCLESQGFSAFSSLFGRESVVTRRNAIAVPCSSMPSFEVERRSNVRRSTPILDLSLLELEV